LTRNATRKTKMLLYKIAKKDPNYHFCGGREKVGKSNNFKNELTMFTP
jgi:hypothetical protein